MKNKGKKVLFVVLAMTVLCFMLSACANADSGTIQNSSTGGTGGDDGSIIEGSNSILIVYFSASGNTERIAEYIAEKTKGTLVEIVPEVAYTSADLNYNNENSRSQVERVENTRPAISYATYNAIDISKYDTVFIGHPIWNRYEPMIIRTFLEHYDGLDGKTVYTFSTSGSSSGGTAFSSINNLCPNADLIENRHFTSSALANAEQTIGTWIDGLNLNIEDESQEINSMYVRINGNTLEITLEENSSAVALVDKLKEGDITYAADDYGNFEKVGNIGFNLPRNDMRINAQAGDVILYQGNSICLYYDTNTWEFTKIGRINGYDETELRSLLGAGLGEVQVTISLNNV